MAELFSITTFALASIVGGILGNRSDAAIQMAVRAVMDRHRRAGPVVNHDIQRAIRKSQLQATLVLCEVLLKELLAGESLWGRVDLHIGGGNDDSRWVLAVRSNLYKELKRVPSAAHVPADSEAQREVELLLTVSEAATKQRVSALREKLVGTVLLEIELLHGKAPRSFVEKLQKEGDNFSPGVEAQFDWFIAMCAFFAHELKHNQALANIFQSQLLAGLKVNDDPLTLELVQSGLRGLGNDFALRLDRIDDQLQKMIAGQVKGFTALEERSDQVITLLAAIPDAAAQRLMLEEVLHLGTERLLTRMEERFKQAEEKRQEQYVRSIPVSRPLLARLEASSKVCEEVNIPYRTPNLLLALLQPDNDVTRRIFNRIDSGFGGLLYNSLLSYVSEEQPALEKGHSYLAFDWYERADVKFAQREALADGHPVVAEKHLLLGILQTDSKTVEDLRAMLGARFLQLLEMIRKDAPSNPDDWGRTPGSPVKQKN